jgi:hypothetical protein
MTLDPFVRAVRDSVAPGFERLGFTLTRIGPRFLELSSPNYLVRLFQGRKSSTIGMELVRDNEVINLQHLLGISKMSSPGMTATTERTLRRCLQWLHDFLFPRFERLFLGDSAEYRNVLDQARANDAHYTHHLIVAPMIRLASEAFREKRYEDVVSILEPLESELTALERRKLTFARKSVAERYQGTDL